MNDDAEVKKLSQLLWEEGYRDARWPYTSTSHRVDALSQRARNILAERRALERFGKGSGDGVELDPFAKVFLAFSVFLLVSAVGLLIFTAYNHHWGAP